MKSDYWYKGYPITRTQMTTTVKRRCPPGTGYRYYDSIERLIDIGCLKPAGKLPFITTLKDAKAYINEHIEMYGCLNVS